MPEEPTLIVQAPRDGAVARQLAGEPPASVVAGAVVLEIGPTDELGNLEAAAAGEIVLSVLSPEGLRRAAAEVRHVIEHAGTGEQPLVVVVEAAEELREDELRPVLEAARRSPRAVILRVIRDG